MNMKELLKQKKVQYSIVGVILILLIIIFLMITQMNKVKIEFKLNDNVIEYGSDQSEIEWKTRSTTNGNKITVAEFDTKKVGHLDIVFTVCLDETCQEFTEQIEIKDTQAPEIIFKSESLEIIEGDAFDPVSNIESVKDPIDEDIKQSNDKEITKDGYIIESDVNTDQIGEYTVKVIAYDVNGNKAEQSYKVIVKEKTKEPDTPVNPPANNNQGNTGGNQSSNGGGSSTNGGNTAQEQPHYRTDISSTYFAQINAWRQQNGLKPLPSNAVTQAEADRRAMELVNNFNHAASYGFGENIGMGSSKTNFFEEWKASPRHNASMLEESINVAMAVSVVEYNGYWYAVTSFQTYYYGN
ncbi:MAG: hypothetical protein HFE68_03310 [Erysipelotrichaceae bacterium]|nr:hypothetical protein [Erysipelotrichaceae bacterium]MCI9312374.1 hypothetical protein [Erysipelotrichaceae bacterium]